MFGNDSVKMCDLSLFLNVIAASSKKHLMYILYLYHSISICYCQFYPASPAPVVRQRPDTRFVFTWSTSSQIAVKLTQSRNDGKLYLENQQLQMRHSPSHSPRMKLYEKSKISVLLLNLLCSPCL